MALPKEQIQTRALEIINNIIRTGNELCSPSDKCLEEARRQERMRIAERMEKVRRELRGLSPNPKDKSDKVAFPTLDNGFIQGNPDDILHNQEVADMALLSAGEHIKANYAELIPEGESLEHAQENIDERLNYIIPALGEKQDEEQQQLNRYYATSMLRTASALYERKQSRQDNLAPIGTIFEASDAEHMQGNVLVPTNSTGRYDD